MMHRPIALIKQAWGLQQAIVGLTCIVGILSAASSAMAAEKPNIVFILSDDQGYGDLAM